MQGVNYLPYNEIDRKKWDACITGSTNNLIYAKSFYLDAMAENWDGLILNDYEAVMPFCWKKKFGIKYGYQPAFTQQGGVYCRSRQGEMIVAAFLHKIFTTVKFAEISLNFHNIQHLEFANVKTSLRNNFVLDIGGPYERIATNFHPHFKKSLRRIQKFNLKYFASHDYSFVIQLYKKLYGEKMKGTRSEDFEQFEELCDVLSTDNNVITRMAFDENNKLLSASVLLKDGKRIYNIISCATAEGRLKESNYFLYDNIIQEFCEDMMWLDMEGSDLAMIAAFYKKLNPVNQPYPFIKYNALNPFLKIFKP
ncbi:MAG: hypothetical protein ABIO05_06750 [Ferruginibacter sp.]